MANAELLRKVLNHIKDNPDEYDATRWHRDFAGHTLRLAMPGIELRTDDMDIETMHDADGERMWAPDIASQAQQLLGLSAEQSVLLFCGANTVADLSQFVAEFTAAVPAV